MITITNFLLTILAASTAVLARPNPLTPDPSGDKNIGNAAGVQFIGGSCLSSADCASTCCAKLSGGGICSGLGAQFQAGKQGCGFGDGGAAPPSSAPSAVPSRPAPLPTQPSAVPGGRVGGGGCSVNASLPGSQNVGKGNGSQFITGQCLSDADCQSGCCANPAGVCSAVAVKFDSGKQGCGFGAA
ncbi:colipase [Microdochium nivale]|nr:colipase [Microdochium nivale]